MLFFVLFILVYSPREKHVCIGYFWLFYDKRVLSTYLGT